VRLIELSPMISKDRLSQLADSVAPGSRQGQVKGEVKTKLRLCPKQGQTQRTARMVQSWACNLEVCNGTGIYRAFFKVDKPYFNLMNNNWRDWYLNMAQI
jgi:hypothetical protein